MTVTITAFERSPDGGMGLARDTRVRWALEEVGQSYEVRLVSIRAKQEPTHLRVHPFGLIPTYEEGDLILFETGAIVLHIAERHAPRGPFRTMPRRERGPSPGCSPRSTRWSRRSSNW
jgi:glutathione S-transferase